MWKSTNEISDRDELLTVDRRRAVRSAPSVDGTALWIDEDQLISVDVIDESSDGLGVVIPAETSFEFGPVVLIEYKNERRSAVIAHLTRSADDSYRLGLTWI